MKCSACYNKECEREHKNRHMCKGEEEEVLCYCTCQVSTRETFLTSAASIAAGVGAVGAGITLTVLTGGLALLGAAPLITTGVSMVKNPVKKIISGEHMRLMDSVKDVALGATIGKARTFVCMTRR